MMELNQLQGRHKDSEARKLTRINSCPHKEEPQRCFQDQGSLPKIPLYHLRQGCRQGREVEAKSPT
jgi:hypothetical protein